MLLLVEPQGMGRALKRFVMSEKLILPEIVEATFKNHWTRELTAEAYHADKTAINSSSLRQIEVSPYNFLYRWKEAQRVGVREELPKHLKLGHALHTALLEPTLFQQLYIVEPKFIGKTKKGEPSENCDDSRRMRKEWLASLHPHALPLKEQELQDLNEMINSVLSHNYACGLLQKGVPEVTGYYRDPVTGIKCRIRPDFMNFDLNTLIDVKTTKSCYKSSFRKSIYDYGYHIQTAMYADGIKQIDIKSPEHCVFIAIQNCAPFEVAVYEADETILEKGYESYRLAMDKLAACLETNTWPRYQAGIEPISLPDWALRNKEDGELINE